MADSLHKLTRKYVKFEWTIKEKNAFDSLKKNLALGPGFVNFDLHKQFLIEAYACGTRIEFILIQEVFPISHESRSIKGFIN